MSKKEKTTPIKNAPKFSNYWIFGIIFLVLIGLTLYNQGSDSREISIAKFENVILPTNDVEQIEIINESIANIYLKKEALKKNEYTDTKNRYSSIFDSKTPNYFFRIGDLQNFENRLESIRQKYDLDFTHDFKIDNRGKLVNEIFTWILVAAIFIGIWLFIMKRLGAAGGGPGGQIFNIGKSKAKLFDQNNDVKISFKDVAGLQGAKEEVEEVVDFLKSPTKYTSLGGKIPKGVLLIGAPGTGKTLLAKAVAGEAKVPFFSLSGSDFVEMFVGVGASRVRDLFRQAKEKSPVIVFIDEIDAIGRARGKNNITGSNDERENTLNQLLTEMDGFETDTNVIVIGATNRSDVLDKALMRAGRFDRRIYVDLPDLKEREEIFNVHLKPLTLDKSVDPEFMARQTPGFSGADIANVCNEAALVAARKNKKKVYKQDFLDAIDRIIGGLEKKNKIIKPHEKRRIAFHEAGHATISWLIEHAAPLVKVTIVPRGQSLGAAWYLPEERQITTTEQMLDEICAALGGRAAEQVIFGDISTGALSDLEKVTKQAQSMVSVFGLNDKIGNISYYDSSGKSDYSFSKPYSEATAQLIDQEVSKLIEEQYSRAKRILLANKNKLENLADVLLDKEVIFKEDLEKVFGLRSFNSEEGTEQKVEERIKP